MMPDLAFSITIANWNTRKDLSDCLKSLEAVRDEVPFEVIVVDNASTDGSADMVEADFPWVRLLKMPKNVYFTGAHNRALAVRNAPHAFLLNSDTVVHPGALKTLMHHCTMHPEAGILGPKLLNPDGSLQFSCRRFPNPLATLFRNTVLGRLFPNNKYTREYLMTDWQHDSPREVDWVSGAAMFVTHAAMERVGLLDPNYVMFCEDVDWCYRVHKAGFKVVYVPKSEITHAIGRSTSQAAKKMLLRFHASMLRFYRVNMLPELFMPIRPFAYAGAAMALFARASVFIVKILIDEGTRRKVDRGQ
jgi:GT2 family glycosyltransferase